MKMKIKVESYKIVCDGCGDTFYTSDDFACFIDDVDGSLIKGEAESSSWISIGNKHYCPDCHQIDDDDNIVTKDGKKYDGETYEEIV